MKKHKYAYVILASLLLVMTLTVTSASASCFPHGSYGSSSLSPDHYTYKTATKPSGYLSCSNLLTELYEVGSYGNNVGEGLIRIWRLDTNANVYNYATPGGWSCHLYYHNLPSSTLNMKWGIMNDSDWNAVVTAYAYSWTGS